MRLIASCDARPLDLNVNTVGPRTLVDEEMRGLVGTCFIKPQRSEAGPRGLVPVPCGETEWSRIV